MIDPHAQARFLPAIECPSARVTVPALVAEPAEVQCKDIYPYHEKVYQ